MANLLMHSKRAEADAKRRLDKKAELSKNTDLTEAGQKRQALDFMFRDVMANNLKGRRDLAKAERALAAKRASLKMPKADPSDLVGAFRRARKCDRLLNMTQEQRDKYAMKHRDNPEFRLAMIEARADGEELGISEMLFKEMVNSAVEETNGPLLEEMKSEARDIEIARKALDSEYSDIRKEAIAVDPAYADPDRFHASVTQAANLPEPLWLKKFEENGAEVVRALKMAPDGTTGSWAQAAPNEIDNGFFAETREEFEKLKTAAPLGSFGTGAEGRKARAEFINQNGLDAYFNRNAAA
jgi:hypothetical protein